MAFTTILLRLLLAHLIGDFILQPNKWTKGKAKNKIKSKYLYWHSFVHAALAYVLIADWNQFLLPILVFAAHWSIDLLKSYKKPNFKWFAIDQILHLVSLLLIWLLIYGQFNNFWEQFINLTQNKTFWWLLLGYLFILNPTAIIIATATKEWQKELKDKEESLNNAGKWIGILERVLTLTFILFNQFAAIGFLIAAKSIFRFGDLTNGKERKLTEYILIGTFLSFTITIIIGVLIKSQIS